MDLHYVLSTSDLKVQNKYMKILYLPNIHCSHKFDTCKHDSCVPHRNETLLQIESKTFHTNLTREFFIHYIEIKYFLMNSA